MRKPGEKGWKPGENAVELREKGLETGREGDGNQEVRVWELGEKGWEPGEKGWCGNREKRDGS